MFRLTQQSAGMCMVYHKLIIDWFKFGLQYIMRVGSILRDCMFIVYF